MTFKVGDRVRLTGPGWKDAEVDRDDIHTVEKLEYSGEGVIRGGWIVYDREDDDWGASLVNTPRLTNGDTKTTQTFAMNVNRILNGVAETIIQKNLSYGDSALNPIRVFSKADRIEQLNIRLDDKLSRVQRGSEYPGDDTLRDIIGYVTLMLIARESQ